MKYRYLMRIHLLRFKSLSIRQEGIQGLFCINKWRLLKTVLWGSEVCRINDLVCQWDASLNTCSESSYQPLLLSQYNPKMGKFKQTS